MEKAVDEKQPDGTVLDHLGDAYEKLGRHSQAVAAWQRAKAALEKDKEPEKARKVGEKIGNRNDADDESSKFRHSSFDSISPPSRQDCRNAV